MHGQQNIKYCILCFPSPFISEKYRNSQYTRIKLFRFHRNIAESSTIFIPTYTDSTTYWNLPTCSYKRHKLNLIFIIKLCWWFPVPKFVLPIKQLRAAVSNQQHLITGILIIRTHDLRKMWKQHLLHTYFL